MFISFGAAVLVLTLAGFVQGMTGFGFGLVAMALLPSIVDFPLASLLVVLFTIPVSAINFFDNRHHYHWRKGISLVLGMCCGVPFGVYVMVQAPRELLLRSLGALLLAFAFNETLLSKRKLHLPHWLGFPIGFSSGILGGAFNMGGPPSVAYCYSRPWRKEEVVALLQVIFVISAVLRLLLLSAKGIVPPDSFSLVLWAAVPVIGAVVAGTRLFRRIGQTQLRLCVFLFLGVMGVKYLAWP
jgi:uncharacterized membrane protein YfcA